MFSYYKIRRTISLHIAWPGTDIKRSSQGGHGYGPWSCPVCFCVLSV
jgi:hypothetical protein